ncbi:hypothetical protein [Klebsiella quasipneumoniae]|uniref:hypothetical protein n=1 Tax=Klebsiella quasipneumoniae TaxID=1463165 RepID=UPI003BA0D82D
MAQRYNTGNQRPSNSMKDLNDNALAYDDFLNGDADEVIDRLGKSIPTIRKTIRDANDKFHSQITLQDTLFLNSQIDKENRFTSFLDSSGYVFLGDYQNGPFQFSARNQYIRYNNQHYRLNTATDVGFTTTGTDAASFANDVTHFVLMDGDTLRQNLGSSEEGFGDTLVTHVKKTKALPLREYLNGSIQYVTPFIFGGVGGSTTADNNQAIQDMLAFAKLFGFGVDLRGGPWRITETADFLGIYSVLSDWSGKFLVDSNNFTAAHTANYVLTFGDPDGDAYTGRASYVCITGTIGIVSDNRDVELNGVYFKGSHFDVGYVRVNGLNGSAIMLSAVWDSLFTRLSAQDSGNINNYQVGIVSGGDTSNCLKISAIQSENAYHKCLIIGCIRSEIGNIHAERTSVLTTNDGTTGLQSTLTYTNVLINVGNTSIGQIIHDCRTTGTAPDGSPLAATNSSVVVNLDYTSSIKDASFSGSIGNTMFGRNSTYGQMGFLDWYFGGANVSNLTFIGPRCIGTLHPNQKAKFINGTYNAVVPLFGAADLDFDNCDITSLTFPNNIGGNISFRKCRYPASFTLGDTKQPTGFTGDSTLGETKRPVFFDDCEFLGTVAGAYRARAIFRDCMIATVALVSRAAFNFKGCKITTFGYSGDRAFTTERCAVTTVSSWGVPNQILYPIGAITERPGEDTAGAGVLFRCSSQTATAWAKLI